MGRKRNRTREFIHLCIASLIFFALFGCAALEKIKVKIGGQEKAYQHLDQGKRLLVQGDYEGAVNENLKILSLAHHTPPEDEALFNMGLIYAHSENPKKDYGKSLRFFKKLIKDYPQSPWVQQTKIWVGMLQENERLNQTIEKLYQPIDNARHMNIKSGEHGEARETFLRAQTLLAQGDYEGAIKENQRVLSLSGKNPPGDEALFNMGLIYAHSGNPKKDYGKSLGFFKKLIKDYPQSPWIEQTKIWVGMLQENEKLSRSIEELNQVIEKSKQVDIEIEEKKREKAK
jgi:tetratricopeptide (TPR) repeat protein